MATSGGLQVTLLLGAAGVAEAIVVKWTKKQKTQSSRIPSSHPISALQLLWDLRFLSWSFLELQSPTSSQSWVLPPSSLSRWSWPLTFCWSGSWERPGCRLLRHPWWPVVQRWWGPARRWLSSWQPGFSEALWLWRHRSQEENSHPRFLEGPWIAAWWENPR